MTSIHGKIYYQTGAYGYGMVESTHENTSGCSSVMSGMTKKLSREIANNLNRAQSDALESFMLARLLGDTANSENLYLWTTNTREIYDRYALPLLKQLKSRLDVHKSFEKFEPYDLLSIVRSTVNMFEHGAELYEKAFPKGFHKDNEGNIAQNDWYNFTPLDFSVCAMQWLEAQLAEWKVNGLE